MTEARAITKSPLEVVDELDAPTGDEVLGAARAAARVDGVLPLNEAAQLGLAAEAGDVVRHLLLRDADLVVGYAQLDTPPDAPATAQLFVHPTQRRQGIGRGLLALTADISPPELGVWAFGDTPAAQGLAARDGWRPRRELLSMRRRLETPPPLAPAPPGVDLRPFRPGADDAAWLAVNARAFASHPEQGRMGRADLSARLAEPWFDAADFLVAEADGRLVGYHWTKHHSASLGEVYVLGVDPDFGGRGLGKALLTAGLLHLAATGVVEVELYVEGDAERPRKLYERYGFVVAGRDVMYERPTASRPDQPGSGGTGAPLSGKFQEHP